MALILWTLHWLAAFFFMLLAVVGIGAVWAIFSMPSDQDEDDGSDEL